PQPGGDVVAHHRNGAEQVGDDGGAPEGHLAPGQHIAEEGGCYHQQVDQHANDPDQLAPRLVGAVIETAADEDLGAEEEDGVPLEIHLTDGPAIIDVAHDALDAVEGQPGIGDIMHRQHDAGDDLDAQAEGEDAAEGVPDVQVPGRGEGLHRVVHQTQHGQTRVEPAL